MRIVRAIFLLLLLLVCGVCGAGLFWIGFAYARIDSPEELRRAWLVDWMPGALLGIAAWARGNLEPPLKFRSRPVSGAVLGVAVLVVSWGMLVAWQSFNCAVRNRAARAGLHSSREIRAGGNGPSAS